jgi:imidazolonepropionase-like amidohydrolase
MSEPVLPERWLLFGGSVFDGSGSPPERADVLIEGGRIVSVGLDLDTRAEVAPERVLDVTGQIVLPGMIDCHVHVLFSDVDSWKQRMTPFSLSFYQAGHNLKLTLDAGVTTCRDALGADYGVKHAQEMGLITGPRLLIAIQMLGQTGGHGDCFLPSGHDSPLRTPYPGFPDGVVDGVQSARRVVRELVRARADWIKIAATGGVLSDGDLDRRQFRDDELSEIVTEAGVAGLSVMAHAMNPEGVKAAIKNGVRSIEHGVYLDDECVDLMVEHGTWLVPTLVAPRAVVAAAADGRISLPRGAVDKATEAVAAHGDSFRRAIDAGVKIALGTDAGVSAHGANLDELASMVACGLPLLAALHAGTGGAAELLGYPDTLGVVRPGAVADLLVLSELPPDLRNLSSKITRVLQSGRHVSPGPSLSTGLPERL